MNNTIFEKLQERIDKRKFDKIQVGQMEMWGFMLSKTAWREYQKALLEPILKSYKETNIMWFRGYPLKQKK